MIPVQQRKTMINRQSKTMSIKRQSSLLSLSRSGFYYQPSQESKTNLDILSFLDKQYLKTPFYGVERLHALLAQQGMGINRKRLRRLMKLVDWHTLYQEPHTTVIEAKSYKYPYLLKNLEVSHKNQVWAIDITYIPMQKGFMYLFAIIDLYSRYVVGWNVSNTMNADWCVDCIKTAVSLYGKPLIINSDQGSQFTSDVYTNYLKTNGIQISMDSKGRALDNIFIERLWRTVKYEYVYINPASDGVELWKGLDGYFRFYNTVRIHKSLGYCTPYKVYYGDQVA
ncbi:integrase [Bacteroidia bacterium]|nr:integrase [Bacteroidia bacterium]